MRRIVIAGAAAFALIASPAAAAIVLGPTVNGIATFTDTNTGLNWARLDTYFNVSYNFMAADLTGKGFTLAVKSDLDELFATVNVAADFGGVAAITGSAPNRRLIWGAYSPLSQNGTVDWAFAFSGNQWTFGNQGFLPNEVPNGDGPEADMNFWAYTRGRGTPVIPEPATWTMLIAGFGLVGFVARRRRAVATPA